MTIRRAQSGDLDGIRSLLQSCDLPHEDLTSAHLEDFLVGHEDGTLRGVVGLEPCGDVALLRSLAVSPTARGEGLGARLVEAAEDQAYEKGVGGLYLLTTTAADYFRTQGFETVARDALPEPIQQTEEATRLCPSSATCMRKTLLTAVDAQTAE